MIERTFTQDLGVTGMGWHPGRSRFRARVDTTLTFRAYV
jgi:hypothetical protein